METLSLPPHLCSLEGRPFLLHDNKPAASRILVFGSAETVGVLTASDAWVADGTFRTAPHPFAQIYTVHAMRRNFVIPALHILLPDKKEATYREMWRAIKNLLPAEAGGPPQLLLDFELACWKTFQHVFPGVPIGGCFFHFRQAIHRRLQQEGLTRRYGASRDFRARVAKLCALAFCPTELVPDIYERLAIETVAAFEAIANPDEQTRQENEAEQRFLKYFEETWVGLKHQRGRGRKPAKIAIDRWSTYSRILLEQHLTTNNAEVYHRHFKLTYTAVARPHMARVLEELQRRHILTEQDVISLSKGGSRPQRKETLDRDAAVRVLLGEWNARRTEGNHMSTPFMDAMTKLLLADVV